MTRELPNSLKIEQSLLGSLMIYPNVMNDCQDLDLKFLMSFLRQVINVFFQCMKEIKDNGQPLDINTIVTRLQDKDELEAAGGADISLDWRTLQFQVQTQDIISKQSKTRRN